MDVSKPKLTSSGLRGGREALRAVAAAHAPALLGYCLRRLGDRHLAEDAVQEVFLRAHRHSTAKREEVRDVSAWLFGVARRCCQEIVHKRRRDIVSDVDLIDAWVSADPADDPAARFSQQLEHALCSLKNDEQSVIYMKHTQGLKCREIADRTGRPLGTVTSTLTRAYAKIRSFMETQDG
ncbi:MAG TPA: sigma-70 family RNA polymerase sigma factor [Phycisphaerae bacterium]|nr:sigma-70 family RNA polymerase sigma factor [Phycisphaerae bacterium]